jgi:hypothetical protein
MHYLQPIRDFTIFFLCKTNIFQKFIKPTKKFFWPKQKNTCLMILEDKPNCQISRILRNPRPILSDSSENDPNVNAQPWKNPWLIRDSNSGHLDLQLVLKQLYHLGRKCAIIDTKEKLCSGLGFFNANSCLSLWYYS